MKLDPTKIGYTYGSSVPNDLLSRLSKQFKEHISIDELDLGADHKNEDAYKPEDKKTTRLTILHTNDIHGHLEPFVDKNHPEEKEAGGISFLSSALRRERSKDPERTLLLDAGDVADGGPVSDHFNGIPIIDAMSHIGYDAMTAGNHDVAQGHEDFNNLVNRASFPILSANLVQKGPEDGVKVKPYVIKESGGIKVGVLGLTSTDTEKMMRSEDRSRMSFLSPEQVARDNIPKMKKEGAQLIVLLSHLGLEEDRKIAQNVEGVDLIVGGHSHTRMEQPENVNGVYIAQTGSFGANYGRIDLKIGKKGDRAEVLGMHSKLIPVSPENAMPDSKVWKIVDQYNRKLKPYLSRKIGEAPKDMVVRDYHVFKEESALGNFVCDTMRKKLGADVFISATSAFRSNIEQGDVTVGSIYSIFPWKNKATVLDMKGKDLKKVLEEQVSGPMHCGAYSGIKVIIDSDRPKGQQLVNATLADGKPIEDNKIYSVGTENIFADGNFEMKSFKNAVSRKDYDTDVRDMLIEAIEENPVIQGRTDGRLINLADSSTFQNVKEMLENIEGAQK